MSIQKTSALKEFHILLDEVIQLQTKAKKIREDMETIHLNSREIFVQAVQIMRDTGLGDYEISELVREYLRSKIPRSSLSSYLSELKPELEESTSQSDQSQNDDNNDTEQEEENPPEISVTTEGSQVSTPVEPNQREDEEQTELELKDIEIQQLKDALHKTQQFRTATQLQQPPPISNPDEHYFKFLTDRADGVSSFYYDTYGIDLFKNRELSQLKNSGVKVFKRLYFEV